MTYNFSKFDRFPINFVIKNITTKFFAAPNTMPLDQTCRFCAISQGTYLYGLSDQPFLENDLFYAIPSIGSLIEGWSLVVPKNHTLSLRNMYGSSPFVDFTSEVVQKVASKYGDIIVFEHGACGEESITHCGTGHAHLHIVPFPFSLKQDLLGLADMQWESISDTELSSLVKNDEYLFYCENYNANNREGLLHVLKQPTSQFFRKLIAEKLGKTDVSDYRRFLHLNISEKTSFHLSQSV